jgi:hypothetical protein
MHVTTLNEMLRDINSSMNNIDLDNINIPQLHTDGMRPNQFKTFYSLHGSTLFQPVLSLNAKLSLLCFSSEALASIHNHTSKVFNGRYQRMSYIADMLHRDVFSLSDFCVTAKQKSSTSIHLFQYEDDDDFENHSDAKTPKNLIASSSHHSTKFFPNTSTSSHKIDSLEPPHESPKIQKVYMSI